MPTTATDAIAERMARKFTVLDVMPAGSCQRVYVATLPKTPEVVVKRVEACGYEVARVGWDRVGGQYVDVREGV